MKPGEHVELLQAFIRNACVNDGSGSANEEPNADLVVTHLEGSGFDIEVFDAAPGRRSVVARLAGTNPAAPSLMLLGHTDVVPAVPERWREDPFGAELIDGEIWGRGALDMLGHVATMTLAARDFAKSGSNRGGDVVVAMVADEEALGRHGLGWLMQHAPDAVRADWVITETGGVQSGPPDATRITVLTREKGAWRVQMRLNGRPGHSAMPYGSQNALEVAVEAISLIARADRPVSIHDEWRAFVTAVWGPEIQDRLLDPEGLDRLLPVMPDFPARVAHSLTRMTVVPTSMTTDSSWNTLPTTVTVEFDVRTLPGDTGADVLAHLSDAVGELAAQCRFSILDGSPSSASPPGTELWELCQDAARAQVPRSRLMPTMAPGVTDARFMREAGAIAYGFGMVSPRAPVGEIPRMLHGDDERVDLESLAMTRRLWTDMLDMHAERTRQDR